MSLSHVIIHLVAKITANRIQGGSKVRVLAGMSIGIALGLGASWLVIRYIRSEYSWVDTGNMNAFTGAFVEDCRDRLGLMAFIPFCVVGGIGGALLGSLRRKTPAASPAAHPQPGADDTDTVHQMPVNRDAGADVSPAVRAAMQALVPAIGKPPATMDASTALGLGVLLLLIGCFTLVVAVVKLRTAFAVPNWPTTTGYVTRAMVEQKLVAWLGWRRVKAKRRRREARRAAFGL